MKCFDVAGKNIKTIFRDKKNLLFIILIPVFFYSVQGFIFGEKNESAEVYVYQIGWVDQDTSESGDPIRNVSFIRSTLDNLETMDIQTFSTNQSASDALKNKEIDAYIIIPQDFELYLNGTLSSPSANLTIIYLDSSSDVTLAIVTSTILGVIDGTINYNPNEIRIYVDEQRYSGKSINQITTATPGYLMYGILSSLSSAVILLTQEHKNGQLKRLETSQVKGIDMILGHMMSNTIVILVQFFVGVLTLSAFGFSPNYYNYGSLIFGTLITVILLSIFQNGLGMVVSSIMKTPESAGGGVWILLIPLMTFSGAFFPLEFVAPGIIPYVGWIPTRIVVLLFQDFMVNAVSIFNINVWLQFLWLLLESIGLLVIGALLYRQFARS